MKRFWIRLFLFSFIANLLFVIGYGVYLYNPLTLSVYFSALIGFAVAYFMHLYEA